MQIFQSFTPEVVELLKNGAIGVIPTDTVYGLVTLLNNAGSIERIYQLKDRDVNKRIGTILINDPVQIEHLTDPSTLLRAQVYWPGPVSVVLPVPENLHYAHRGHDTLAFRLPHHPSLQNLLAAVGPLASTSANFAGYSPAATIEEAMGYFREAVDFYVNGGDLSSNEPSKIIQFNPIGEVEIIRGDKR